MLSSNMLLLNLILLIDVTFSTPTGDYTHPMKEDVKRKFFAAPSAETWVWRLASSPVWFLEGVLVLPLWFAAYGSGDASPSC
jgi:hypothetical protein